MAGAASFTQRLPRSTRQKADSTTATAAAQRSQSSLPKYLSKGLVTQGKRAAAPVLSPTPCNSKLREITAMPALFDVNYFCRSCRLFLPVHLLLLTPLLSHPCSVAGDIESRMTE